MFGDPRSELDVEAIRGAAVIPIHRGARRRVMRRRRRLQPSDGAISAHTSLVRRIPLRSRMARSPATRLLALLAVVLTAVAMLTYLAA